MVKGRALADRHSMHHRLRSPETLDLFTRIFSATAAEARGTEFERLQLVPLVFGLLPVGALARKRPDERIKPYIRSHLSSLRVEPLETLVDTLKNIADQYYTVVLRQAGERPRKFGVESVRALRTNVYRRLHERQASRCAVCGVRLGEDTGETLDHIIPWALVGDRFDGSNWQLLCGTCNGGKREWLSVLQSPQAVNWHYGAADALPLAEPTREARYLALALAGGCTARSCDIGPRTGRLVVVRRSDSGLAVLDNLLVLCTDHLGADRGHDSEAPSPTARAAEETPLAQPASRVQGIPEPRLVGTFGGYALTARLSGGMAESFLALDEETGQEVFLKRALEGTPDGLAMEREAQIYQKLEIRYAEHVPRVLNHGRVSGYSFLVMERADTDLEKHVEQKGQLSPGDAKLVLFEILEGLEELHGMEIVHRDLKPSNILLIGQRWVLADFGISKDHRAAAGGRTFQLRGTTGYAAPEQILIGVEARPPADVFAVGKIAVYLLTGTTDIDRVLSRAWRDFARQCTADEPEKRPCIPDVRAALQQIVE